MDFTNELDPVEAGRLDLSRLSLIGQIPLGPKFRKDNARPFVFPSATAANTNTNTTSVNFHGRPIKKPQSLFGQKKKSNTPLMSSVPSSGTNQLRQEKHNQDQAHTLLLLQALSEYISHRQTSENAN